MDEENHFDALSRMWDEASILEAGIRLKLLEILEGSIDLIEDDGDLRDAIHAYQELIKTRPEN